MNDFVKFLEEVKKQHQLESNKALGKLFGFSQSRIYQIMDGMSIPSDDACIRIARATGHDPAYVIALAHKCNAKTPDVTKAWNQILKKVAPAALAAFIILSAFQELGEASTGLHKSDKTIHYQTHICNMRIALHPGSLRLSS